jgi:hypothetical protein
MPVIASRARIALIKQEAKTCQYRVNDGATAVAKTLE